MDIYFLPLITLPFVPLFQRRTGRKLGGDFETRPSQYYPPVPYQQRQGMTQAKGSRCLGLGSVVSAMCVCVRVRWLVEKVVGVELVRVCA